MQAKARVLSGTFAIIGLGVLAALMVGSATSCDWFRRTPTPTLIVTRTPVSTPTLTPTATPTQPPVVELPPEILAARDVVLVFLRSEYPDKAPPDGIAWTGRDTTPPGVVGVSTYEFTGDGWLMTVAALSISPTEVLYEMGLDNPQTGLHWTGSLDADYNLLGSNLNVPVEVLVTREIVLAYVRENYAAQAPAENLVWIGERTTPSGVVGHETCQFTSVASPAGAGRSTSGETGADDWTMTVDYDLVSPDQVVYEVDLRRASTGFVWRGQVDAEGTVLEHR